MDSLNKFLVSFNTNYLRFGPTTVCIFIFILIWIYAYQIEYCFVPEVSELYTTITKKYFWQSLLGLFIVSGTLSVILTWPMLVLHVFRFDGYEIKQLAYKRDRLTKNGERECEFIDTYRHCREYGSNLLGIGLSILQLFIIFDEFFYSNYMESFKNEIFLFFIFTTIIGLVVWIRGIILESKFGDESCSFLRSNLENREKNGIKIFALVLFLLIIAYFGKSLINRLSLGTFVISIFYIIYLILGQVIKQLYHFWRPIFVLSVLCMVSFSIWNVQKNHPNCSLFADQIQGYQIRNKIESMLKQKIGSTPVEIEEIKRRLRAPRCFDDDNRFNIQSTTSGEDWL